MHCAVLEEERWPKAAHIRSGVSRHWCRVRNEYVDDNLGPVIALRLLFKLRCKAGIMGN